MASYKVTWTIEVEASSPLEAAKLCLEIQRDPQSEATAFEVENEQSGVVYEIDLDPEKVNPKVQ